MRLIKCRMCKRSSTNHGYGLCNVCVRTMRRKQRPNVYLATCYSGMLSRCKDKRRPTYYNKPICTREEFINKFVTDPQFLKLYRKWQNLGHKRKDAPSIDRIDNDRGYTLDNMQFISVTENATKDYKKPTVLRNPYTKEEYEFSSQKEAAEFIGCNVSCVHKTVNTGSKIKKKWVALDKPVNM